MAQGRSQSERDDQKLIAQDQARSRLADIERSIDRVKWWLALLLPVYLALRILVFSHWNEAVTLEVVRAQGISGIAEAAVLSVSAELSELGFLAAAVVFLVGIERDSKVLKAAGVAATGRCSVV